MKTEDLSDTLLARGVEEVIVCKHLESRLKSGAKLRVKFGIDPTAPDLHLGHTVPLRKLRAFQDAGHTAVIIIGDFTAMIGDPSGKSSARLQLTAEEIKKNMKSYLAQAGSILDIKKTEIRYNSEWYKKGGVPLLYDLMSKMTIQRALERDDFQKRIKDELDVTLLEVLYPLLQGYDSVAVRADVEIGGTDQKFNLLTGRKIQRRFGMAEQDILTTPLLEGTDGTRKMSKSVGNYIALRDAPDDMFGKIMSVPDALIAKYFTLLTDELVEVIAERERAMASGALNPRDVKFELGEAIVAMYHGIKKAKAAHAHFFAKFSKEGVVREEDIPDVKIPSGSLPLIDILTKYLTVSSRAEARRLVLQGAIEVDSVVVNDPSVTVTVQAGMIIRVGKKKIVRVE
ncbi:MAG: tyrosine--tRNA ligase [bacterium]|nr:tyrosine--tRNA ligase [bacterium]